MVRVDYHVHGEASYDSSTSPEALLDRAIRSGIGLLCVTDHDTLEGAIRLAAIRCPDVRVVVGCEFTADDGSHVIGLGLRDVIVERRLPALLEEISNQGALVLLPHPFRRGTGIFRNELRRPASFVEDVVSRADLVECFNARDTYENNARNRRLAETSGLGAVAGSDAHRAHEIGSVFVEYDDDEPVHGASLRRIFYPPQPPAFEAPLKRRVMELYHRHERRLPAALRDGYRLLRRLLHADDRRSAGALPRRQHELGSVEADAARREARDRRRRVGAPPGDAPARDDRDRAPRQGDVAR
jgi:predicted metal-dependent phosphoesterase TrpH